MSTANEITKGIGAHGMWKQRIINAIDTGESEWTPAIVRQDNQCEFGKWLHSCSPQDKSSPHHEKVKELHSTFHQVAADVLALALSGNKEEAHAKIDRQSEYSSISSQLTREMMAWKNTVH